MNFTISEENYLKAIFHLQQDDNVVSTNDLAEHLQTKAASVTDMMKKLNAKNLINYTPYYGFSLSAEGRKAALFIVRKHRIWEFFLGETLKFKWNEIHGLAEELEHVSSKKLIDRLDSFLGYPRFDPHGDPIPDIKGKINRINKIPLTKLKAHQIAEVCQVTNQTNEMLELLTHKNISLGSKIEIKRHFDFDDSLELKVRGATVTISNQLAQNIFVKYEQ